MRDVSTSGRTLVAAGAGVRASARRPIAWVPDLCAALVGLGFGATVGLALTAETRGTLRAAGGVATFAGRLTGLTGTYLLLVMVLLSGRLPVLERAVGFDRLLRWHRRLAPYPLTLLALHAVLITLGYAEADRVGVLHQLVSLVLSYPDVLAASVALGLLVLAAVTSVRAARRRLTYETWWIVHLYTYLALALAFAHQLATGASFVRDPGARIYWITLWAATAGVVIVYRFGLPI